MALWYTEMKRNLKRFKEVRKEIEVGKWWSSRNICQYSPEIEAYVCEHLGIDTAAVSTPNITKRSSYLLHCYISTNCYINGKICSRNS